MKKLHFIILLLLSLSIVTCADSKTEKAGVSIAVGHLNSMLRARQWGADAYPFLRSFTLPLRDDAGVPWLPAMASAIVWNC